MFKSSITLITFTTIFTLFANHISSQQLPVEMSYCPNGVPESTDIPFKTNLETVLTTLRTQSSASFHFYNTTSGTAPNTVYGQYYCRPDIDTIPCANCVAGATNTLLTNNCTRDNGAVYKEDCALRYSNESVYGILDVTLGSPPGYNIGNVSDPNSFPGVLSQTMDKLINEAVHRSDLFATGKGNETVYCLVQCSPDLNVSQCLTCLQTLYGYISTPKMNMRWPAIEYDYYPSCRMSYNDSTARIQTVYVVVPPPSPLTLSQPPPPPPPSNLFTVSQPPPPPPSNGGSGVSSSYEMKVRIVIAALVILFW